MDGTSSPETVTTKLQRIAKLAKQNPEMVLTTLAHHIDIQWLRIACARTRVDGAVGVDGQTGEEYEREAEANLSSLLDRFKTGSYKAPPVRRVYIPKDNRKTRPIGIPTFEDKVLQRAVAMVLEAVYEQDFKSSSYGFRPGRSAHDALKQLRDAAMQMSGGVVIDLDIQSFFDSLSHQNLRVFLDQRVRDGVIRRAIDKWLKAGVLEDEVLTKSEVGSPQGGVISPILSNIFLHHVLDTWFEAEVLPRLRGKATLVRFADDAVIVCEKEEDAQRIMAVLPKRFEHFGLKLHPEKTRMVPFQRPSLRSEGKGHFRGQPPKTFDFLGFTHFWEKCRKGFWVVKQRTAKSRKSRTLKRIAEWCRKNRHQEIAYQRQALTAKLMGHYAYFGVTGNFDSLKAVYDRVIKIWHQWLNRRGQHRDLNWERFTRILRTNPLPRPRIVHVAHVT
jgi:group II intron reverse transcriptase/maturase